MWLVFDIGNSGIKGGFFDNGMLIRSFRMRADPEAGVTAYRHAVHDRVFPTAPERVGIVSVSPELTSLLTSAVQHELMVLPEVLHSGMSLPLKMGYRTPATLGMDRLAAAGAAHRFFGRDDRDRTRSVVVVDAGTAVTVDAVSATGVFRGGAIAPGPAISLSALSKGTSLLPEVPMDVPDKPIGRSTAEALQSGILFGFTDAVAGLIRRVKEQIRKNPYVVATGGWAPFLSRHVPAIDRVEEDLVLYGGRLLLELNTPDRT